MQNSDWVYVGCTIFLGACALFVPYLAELIKRKWFSPDIKIEFQLEPPFCHQTRWRTLTPPPPFPQPVTVIDEPVYYFRFKVINEGKSRANNCEICLENLWIYDVSQTPRLHQNFSSVNIVWSDNPKKPFVNINPKRKMVGNIGHISSQKYQDEHEHKNFIDVRGDSENGLRFMFDLLQWPFSQPNCLVAGRYIIQVGFYSENANIQKVYFEISWSGEWQDEEGEMFKGIVIKLTSKPE